MIKKGDIGVRTISLNKEFKIGEILQAIGTSSFNEDRFLYSFGYSIPKDHFRLATAEEIEAYHKGCRHIDDLDQYIHRETLLTNIL